MSVTKKLFVVITIWHSTKIHDQTDKQTGHIKKKIPQGNSTNTAIYTIFDNQHKCLNKFSVYQKIINMQTI